MTASLVALLSRMTGQSDIVVGIPHAGQLSRHLGEFEGTERLVGHCANLLPVRLRQVGSRRFAELLLHVKQQLLEARNHQDFTFSKIAESLDVPRDPSRVPLVGVSLTLFRTPDRPFAGLDTRRVFPSKDFNFFDLTIDLRQDDGDLCLDTKFNRDLYGRRSVERWLTHWTRILEQVVESPELPVAKLDLLSDAERQRMLWSWNATERDYGNDAALHSLFETSVDREPERTALMFQDSSLTLTDLEQRANRIAHRLRQMGAGPGQLVAVCLDRSTDLVAVLLGVLKSGAAYVPLDPSYPTDRLAYVLRDTNAKILVTNDGATEHLGEIPCSALNLDLHGREVESQPDTRPDPLAGPDDLAYVIYTSGSTGNPKGVQVEHRAVVNFVRAMADRPGLSTHDRLLAVTTVSFDIAVLEIFLPLYVGATIVLAPREIAVDPEALHRAISRFDITVMQATPATWSMLLEAGWTGSSKLRILCGGDTLSEDLAVKLLPRCAQLWNMYGPTEATVWST